MYTTVKGIYENGQITIFEPVPTNEKSEVIVTFLGADSQLLVSNNGKLREAGSLKKWGEERGVDLFNPG